MSSEEFDKSSKNEKPFELYAKNGLSSEEVERTRNFTVLMIFLKRKSAL